MSSTEYIINTLISVYAVLAVSQLMLQFSLAQLHWLSHLRRRACDSAAGGAKPPLPDITVIYPIYREAPDVLDLVMSKAVECLVLPRLEVIFVDDGSPNLAELLPVYRRYECEGIRVVLRRQNRGKRHVQHVGFGMATGEVIVTVDSDTLITPDGIRRLVRPLAHNPAVGAVTGELRVANSSASILSRLLSLRYWIAFNLERAAQSFCGSMLCCSGPFSAYRREIIMGVKDRFVTQQFLGRTCTYGDDRHLTNLVLAEGYETHFEPGAVAHTFVPETFREFIPQQTRWNKSFYREMLWTLKAFRNVGLYSLWDMLLQPLLSLLFVLILASVACSFICTRDPAVLVYYGGVLILMASIRALYGVIRTGRLDFVMFVLYGFIHVFILMPVRLKSLLTLSDSCWGTRGTGRKTVIRNFLLWAAAYWSVVLVLAGTMTAMLPDSPMLRRDSVRVVLTESPSVFFQTVGACWLRALPFFLVLLAVFVLLSLTRPGKRRGRCPRPPAAGASPDKPWIHRLWFRTSERRGQ